MASALFFEGGMGAVPVKAAENTTGNGTNGSEAPAIDLMQEVTTTTTTEPPAPDPVVKMQRQIFVSVISTVVGLIPAFIVGYLFKRKVHFEKVEEREKRRLLQSWRWKRKVGYGIAMVYLLYCYYFLIMFALNKPMDMQKDFTASSSINMVWKMLLKPVLVFAIITLLISAMRTTTLGDHLMYLLPLTLMDFS
eukprot:CAMPEP_0172913144 /NCGR_PEP_ID=MMETSP1075-20121228/189823_1 /TAXON_ID=2916 /ORGANISM="Ceratium fusus, Strain PA161109" /LENGTH=192 /DNA_ID=CAMNT_0013771785 /DNA_START=144 /DNA_END=719 /DNA_ORIENTATION=+